MAYHCSNCREKLKEDGLKKVSIGQERNVVFCSECNCYVAIEEPKKVQAKKEAPQPQQPQQ